MARFIRIFILVILGVFIRFEFLGTIAAIVVRLLIVGAIGYDLYIMWKESTEEQEEDERQEEDPQARMLMLKKQALFDIRLFSLDLIIQNDERYVEFLKNQFDILWNFILPHNGYLFYFDGKGILKIIHKSIQSEVEWKMPPAESPFFELIDAKAGILIENNLELASKSVPFYDQQSYKPRAFLAFKTVVGNEEKLYWVFDAASANFFNTDETGILETVNKEVKKVLDQAIKTAGLEESFIDIKQKLQLAQRLNAQNNIDGCIEVYSEFIIEQFEASRMTIALRKNEEAARIVKAVGVDDTFKTGFEFALDEGLSGWVIMKNKPYLIDNIDKGEYFIPRFTRQERTNYSLRSFLAVPFQVDDRALGMVSLEHKEENQFNFEDKERLMAYSQLMAEAIHRLKNEQEIGG